MNEETAKEDGGTEVELWVCHGCQQEKNTKMKRQKNLLKNGKQKIKAVEVKMHNPISAD